MHRVPVPAALKPKVFQSTSVVCVGLLVILATTGAAAPGASRFELLMYAASVIMGVQIVIKLFRELLKAAFVLVVVAVVYYLAKVLVTAVFGG